MLLTLLKAKIHRAVVTEASLHYEGSISLPPELITLAGLRQFELVLVADIENGNRFETYVMSGENEKVCLNGAAARLGNVGDRIIVMAWGRYTPEEADAHQPKIVLVDGHNRPKGG